MKKSKAIRRTPISKATTPTEIGMFWDTHDFTDFENRCPDVTDQITVDIQAVRHYVAVEPTLMKNAIRMARRKGLSAEHLINLWIENGIKQTLSRS